MEDNLGKIREQGLGVAAISYDSVAILKNFADRVKITYPLLSDADSAVIRRYGILNESVPASSGVFGIPHPGTYVLNARGEVVAKYFEEDFRTRDTAASILLRQFGITPQGGATVAARHATVRAWASGGDLRPAQVLTAGVEVTLPPRVHVYAPGVVGYKPVALRLTSAPGFTAEAPVYPAARTVTLPVIHETVPVYEGSFRVYAAVALADAQAIEPLLDAGRQFAIQGEFVYQACDDRECYVPETVPLKWTVKVLPFDRARVPAELQRQPKR